MRFTLILFMGLLGLFNGFGLQYSDFEKWVDKTLSAPLPEGIVAFNFNMYDDGDGKWSVEIIGAASFDKEDEDWACDEIFDNRTKCLRWKNSKTWEQNLEFIKSYIERYLKQGRQADLLKDKEGLGVGFVNGNIMLIRIPTIVRKGETVVVKDLPDEIEFLVIYTQDRKDASLHYPYVIRFEDKSHYPIHLKSLREISNSLKRTVIDSIIFEGFKLDSVGIENEDPIAQQALEKVQSLPGHYYGKTDTPVYYYKRIR